jgi:hypothetical protein
MRISIVRVCPTVDDKSHNSVRTTAPGCDYMIQSPLIDIVYRVDIDFGGAPVSHLWKIAERMGWAVDYSDVFTFVILPDSARLHNITDADGAAAIVQQKLRETHA